MGMYGQLGGLLLWLMNVVGEERGISVRGDVIYIYIYIYIYMCVVILYRMLIMLLARISKNSLTTNNPHKKKSSKVILR